MVDRIETKGDCINFGNIKIENQADPSFIETLKEYLKDVDMKQHKANEAIDEFLAGKKDIHEVMLAVEKADISFRLFVKIKNKLVEAYQEIMRMQV